MGTSSQHGKGVGENIINSFVSLEPSLHPDDFITLCTNDSAQHDSKMSSERTKLNPVLWINLKRAVTLSELVFEHLKEETEEGACPASMSCCNVCGRRPRALNLKSCTIGSLSTQ